MIAQVHAKEIVATHAKHCAIWNVEIIVQKLVQELVQGLVQAVVKENVQKPARMIVQKPAHQTVIMIALMTVQKAVHHLVITIAQQLVTINVYIHAKGIVMESKAYLNKTIHNNEKRFFRYSIPP